MRQARSGKDRHDSSRRSAIEIFEAKNSRPFSQIRLEHFDKIEEFSAYDALDMNDNLLKRIERLTEPQRELLEKFLQAAEMGCGIDLRITLNFPDTAPELYAERSRKGESAPEFIERVYGEYLTGDFTRPMLRKLDPKCYQGLANWERAHGRAPINLPTRSEAIQRKIEESAAAGDATLEPYRRTLERNRQYKLQKG